MVSDAPYKADERDASKLKFMRFCPEDSIWAFAIFSCSKAPDETVEESIRPPYLPVIAPVMFGSKSEHHWRDQTLLLTWRQR